MPNPNNRDDPDRARILREASDALFETMSKPIVATRERAEEMAQKLGLTREQVMVLATEIRGALAVPYDYVSREVMGFPVLGLKGGAVEAQRGIERVQLLLDALCRLEASGTG